MSNASEEQGAVSGVDDGGGSTVELGEEDEEESEWGVLGKVSSGSDCALQVLLVLGVRRRRLVRSVADLSHSASAFVRQPKHHTVLLQLARVPPAT